MRIFSKGNRVSQPQYGPGTIASTDDQYTVIEFDNHGKKTFVTNMVTLEASSEPAPTKAGAKRRTATKKKAKEKEAEPSSAS
jgi:Protein of unknown function (DUF3553)